MTKQETRTIILNIIELIANGVKYRTVTSTIKTKYNLSVYQLKRLMKAAYDELKEETEEKLTNLKNINIDRLDTIIENSMKVASPQDYKVAIQAIQEQSKLTGSYSASEADKLLAGAEFRLKLDLPEGDSENDEDN